MGLAREPKGASVSLRCSAAVLRCCCDAPNLGRQPCKEVGGACRAGPSDAQMNQCDLWADCTVAAAVMPLVSALPQITTPGDGPHTG